MTAKWRPQLVTVSYNEAARLLDGGEQVDAVAAAREYSQLDAAVRRGALPARAEAEVAKRNELYEREGSSEHAGPGRKLR